MKKLIYLIALIYLNNIAFSQYLSIYGIEANNYPNVKANFYALDSSGKQISNLNISDLQLIENGSEKQITAISCPAVPEPPNLSVVLTIDVSGSMGEISGASMKLESAKAAAKAWINAMDLIKSECALTTFNGDAYINQDFTHDKNLLINAVDVLVPDDGTSYDAAFLTVPSGALPVVEKGKNKRVIIFLTDGECTVNESDVIQYANKVGAMIFVVTLGMPTPDALKNIAQSTGGRYFENVTTKDDAVNTFMLIFNIANNFSPCEIDWLSYDCDVKRAVTLNISKYNLSAKSTYLIPSNNLPHIEYNPSKTIVFDAITPMTNSLKSITITAQLSAITIDSIISDNQYFSIVSYGGSSPSFTLQPNESRVITIQYAPEDSLYIYAYFNIYSNGCSYENFTAEGGDPNYQRKPIKLTFPNGGEQFAVGSDTIIKWDIVPHSTKVSLYYSYNAGANWIELSDSSSNLKFNWKNIPNTPSTKCLAKVVVGTTNKDEWVRRAGGTNNDYSRAICLDDTGNVYIAGTFVDSIYFNDRVHLIGNNRNSAPLNSDIFIAKYNPNGNLAWARSLCSTIDSLPVYPINNRANGIAVDNYGNIFVTGYFSQNINFFDTLIYTYNLLSTNAFVAKFDNNGKDLAFSKIYSYAGFIDTNLLTGNSIYVNSSGDVYDFGSCYGAYVLANSYISKYSEIIKSITFDSGKELYKNYYLIKYNNILSPAWLDAPSNLGSGGDNFGSSVTMDKDNYLYITGNYFKGLYISYTTRTGSSSNTATIFYPGIGKSDIYIIKKDTNNNTIWGNVIGGYGRDSVASICTDSHGNVYITGTFNDSCNFGGTLKGITPIVAKDTTGDMFLAKYDSLGKCQWAVRGGGYGYDAGYTVKVDEYDNILVGGVYTGIATFGNFSCGGKGNNKNFFAAEYLSDGSCIDVKTLNPGYNVNYAGVLGIAINSNNEIGVTGYFYNLDSNVSFPNGSTFKTDNSDAFVWKIGDKIEYDISDSLWAIVTPMATCKNIDMGKVLVDKTKDSVVKYFIANLTKFPIRIDSINFSGTDASQFALVSPFQQDTLQSTETINVEFRFAPKSVGTKNAIIETYTSSGMITNSITGIGVVNSLEAIANYIDFGKVAVNSPKDSLARTVKNIGITDFKIDSVAILGPDLDQFHIITGANGCNLNPSEYDTMKLEFLPLRVGRTTTELGFYYDGVGSPLHLKLYGEGISNKGKIIIKAGEISGKTGSIVKIPIYLIDGADLVQTTATEFQVDLSFNSTLLVPKNTTQTGTISHGVRDITLTLPLKADSNNIIATIPCYATLGNAEMTVLELTNAVANQSSLTVETQNGSFQLTNICKEGGTRLVFNSGNLMLSDARPNPASGIINIDYSLIENSPFEINLYDMFGKNVMLIESGTRTPGLYTKELDVSELVSGVYFYSLKTGTQSITKHLTVINTK